MTHYPTPDRPGFWWAKLVHPSRMPEGDDWASIDWEPVQVSDNNGEGDEALGVSFPGIEPVQWVHDCIWGPEIKAHTRTDLVEAERAECIEVLRVFSTAADAVEDSVPDETLLFGHYPSHFGGQTELRVGDLRAARSLLSKLEAKS